MSARRAASLGPRSPIKRLRRTAADEGEGSPAKNSPSKHSAKPHSLFFGRPLNEQECEMDHGRSVPKLAVALRRILLEKGALDHPGIFRESASHATLQLSKERIMRGEPAEEVCVGCGPEIVSCLFKVHLRWHARPCPGLRASASPSHGSLVNAGLATLFAWRAVGIRLS